MTAGCTEITLGGSMNLANWETTIKQIAHESCNQAKESGKDRILIDWRAKLEQEPTSLQPFQIDEIVREVRKRLRSTGALQAGRG